MANILCLETATTNCSVAVFREGILSSLREDTDKGYSHAEKLHVFIQETLMDSGLQIKELDAIAVSKGPGSYTGLRIGVSAAKGLCYAADLPLISIPTLDVLARQVKTASGGHIIPLLDARRMEVYAKVLDHMYVVVEDTFSEIITEESFKDYLASVSTVVIGSGAEKLREAFPSSKAVFQTEQLPSAREMINIAEQKFRDKQFEDVAYFEPYYLKDFISG